MQLKSVSGVVKKVLSIPSLVYGTFCAPSGIHSQTQYIYILTMQVSYIASCAQAPQR